MWGQPPSAIRAGKGRLLLHGLQENAAGVAQPDAVSGPAMEADIVREGIAALENSAGLSRAGCVIDDQLDAFVLRQIADNLGVHPGNRLEFSRPIALIVRPREPG